MGFVGYGERGVGVLGGSVAKGCAPSFGWIGRPAMYATNGPMGGGGNGFGYMPGAYLVGGTPNNGVGAPLMFPALSVGGGVGSCGMFWPSRGVGVLGSQVRPPGSQGVGVGIQNGSAGFGSFGGNGLGFHPHPDQFASQSSVCPSNGTE